MTEVMIGRRMHERRLIMDKFELLNSIDFHDLPLEGIGFSPEYPTKLWIEFATFSEEKADYDHWRVEFDDVVRLAMGEIRSTENSSFEIFSFDYSVGDLFEGRFVILTGIGMPDLTITFASKGFQLERIAVPRSSI